MERRGVRGGATVTEATHGPSEDGAGGSETGARAAATPAFDDAEDLLRQVPFFRTLTRLDLARLIGALEDVSFAAGTRIFAEGADGDALYLLKRGRVAITVAAAEGERTLATLEAPAHFGDVGLLLARRTASAAALTEVVAWMLPRRGFERLIHERPAMGLEIAKSVAELLDQRSREHTGAPPTPAEAIPSALPAAATRTASPPRRTGAIVVPLALPLVLWWLRPPGGLTAEGWHTGLILLGAAAAWLLSAAPDFVIALAMAIAWGVAAAVPFSQVFAGFSSPSYLLALGALGLAAAMARSGLLFRVALFLLQVFPGTYRGQVLALLAGGAAASPLVPQATPRVAMILPAAHEISDVLGFPPRSRGSAGLCFAGIIGYGSFGGMFLTGMAANFLILSLMSPAEREQLTWLAWLVHAAPAGIVLFAGTLAMLIWLFRPEGPARATAATVRQQRRVLGPVSRQEMVTIAGLVMMLAGFLLQPVLRIESTWWTLGALVLLVGSGVLDREAFRSAIEWGYLMFLGVLLGAGGVFRATGLDRWIGGALAPLAHSAGTPSTFLVFLVLGIFACRILVPQIPTLYLLLLILVPAAHTIGFSGWVAGFVVQLATYTWLHPRLSDYCRLATQLTRGEMFVERDGIIVGVGLTALTLLAIVVSIPYWRAIGLLPR